MGLAQGPQFLPSVPTAVGPEHRVFLRGRPSGRSGGRHSACSPGALRARQFFSCPRSPGPGRGQLGPGNAITGGAGPQPSRQQPSWPPPTSLTPRDQTQSVREKKDLKIETPKPVWGSGGAAEPLSVRVHVRALINMMKTRPQSTAGQPRVCSGPAGWACACSRSLREARAGGRTGGLTELQLVCRALCASSRLPSPFIATT